jgi:hypothetical protein
VLVMRDGIVGTLALWIGRRRRGSLRAITEEADQEAHDRQLDWRASGATRSGEELL